MSGNTFNLDPRTKIILLISANIVMMMSVSKYFETVEVISLIILLFLYGKNKSAINFFVIFSLMILGEIFIMSRVNGGMQIIVGLFAVMFRRFIPCIIIGKVIVSTTTVSEFVGTMEKLHVSRKIIIPFAVMFRFFPTVKEEWNSIRDAMRMRGIGISVRNIITSPISMLEYMLVPLLSSAVKIGEELSAASLARGIDGKVKRTNICKIGFSAYDGIVIIGSVLFITLSIYVGKVII